MLLCSVSRLFQCYAKFRYAHCRYAQCRYAQCRYAQCRGALSTAPNGPTIIHWTKLKRHGRDKHSSLLQAFTNYGRKRFYNIGLA